MNAVFSDLCFPSPEFQVGRVAFDGTNYYIFIFDTICSQKPCQRFLKCCSICILQPKPQNSTFVIESSGVLSWKLEVFEISKNADTVLNFSYLAIQLPKFQTSGQKLPELEPRVSHSFGTKRVSRKKLLKVLASPQTHFRWNFSVSKSRSVYEVSQYFFREFKSLPLIYPYG